MYLLLHLRTLFSKPLFQLTELSSHVATLVHDSARTAEGHASDMANAESALQAVQIDLSASKAVADELEVDLREEKTARQAAEELASRNAEALALSTRRANELKVDLDAANVDRGLASSEIVALKTEISALRGELEAVLRRAAESSVRISDLESALSAATATAEALGCEFQNLQVGDVFKFSSDVVPPVCALSLILCFFPSQAHMDEVNLANQQAQEATAAAERALAAEHRMAEALTAESNMHSSAMGSSSAATADLIKRVTTLDSQVCSNAASAMCFLTVFF